MTQLSTCLKSLYACPLVGIDPVDGHFPKVEFITFPLQGMPVSPVAPEENLSKGNVFLIGSEQIYTPYLPV